MTEPQSFDPTTYEVPDDATPARCPECGRPFVREELLRFHRGQAHAEALDSNDIDAFEDAYDEESERLRLFRLKALIALVILYFGLLMAYALV
ncbi:MULTISPECIES: C2H2-type zinc finger protein [unclassified Halorhabdus]|uniref:C2H2-type zinc finger protein n=1 Tax=unclassified Halorhabdus TaxID=2621901 RepID=UPI0023DABBA6|nr:MULTISPECIES: C2H2-type zinc finger protein [unclassified Halorhabdus]WEL17446.1 Metal-binding domain [Halorhabdus sp. SVX81]WEL21324.1 Metal-binding domain [Halorhabdus sp. BNX81]